MKQVAFLWIFLMPLWLRGGLTDDAYRAYKRGEESRAFELYNMALQRKNSNKALYNIAVFYEKGIGVRKNLPKALEYYRMLFYRIDDKARQSEICRDPMLPWYRKNPEKTDPLRKGEKTVPLYPGDTRRNLPRQTRKTRRDLHRRRQNRLPVPGLARLR